MLVIHPDECIDCGVCEPECPVDAIKPDTEPGLEKWLELNAEYAEILAQHHGEERTAGGRQGLGRQAGQDQGIRSRSPAPATEAVPDTGRLRRRY